MHPNLADTKTVCGRILLQEQIVDGVTGNDDHGACGQTEAEHLRPHRVVGAIRILQRLVHHYAKDEEHLNGKASRYSWTLG